MGRYQREFRRSLADPDQFWRDASEPIDWDTEPSVVLDRSTLPLYRWFTIADGNDEPVPSTIEDSAALDALRPLLHEG